jgi:hypothetical protein
MTNGNYNYKDRQDCPDSGEILFEQYLEENGTKYHRVGFDSHLNPVANFWKVHPTIRALPDYLVEHENDLTWCQVKGSNNLKLHDYVEYCNFEKLFADQCSFYVVFCFKDTKPIFRTMKDIANSIVGQEIKQWHDGVKYISVPL